MKTILISACLLLTINVSPGFGQQATFFHVFPIVADGIASGGVSYVTNFYLASVANADQVCTVNLIGMTASRLSENTTFTLKSGTIYLFSTNGIEPLASGYATLRCSNYVSAYVSYTYSVNGTPNSMATVLSAPPFTVAQYAAYLNRSDSRFGVAMSNDSTITVHYKIYLSMGDGGFLTKDFELAPKTNTSKFLDELFKLPADQKLIGVVIVADRTLYTTGLLFSGTAFTTMPPTIIR